MFWGGNADQGSTDRQPSRRLASNVPTWSGSTYQGGNHQCSNDQGEHMKVATINVPNPQKKHSSPAMSKNQKEHIPSLCSLSACDFFNCAIVSFTCFILSSILAQSSILAIQRCRWEEREGRTHWYKSLYSDSRNECSFSFFLPIVTFYRVSSIVSRCHCATITTIETIESSFIHRVSCYSVYVSRCTSNIHSVSCTNSAITKKNTSMSRTDELFHSSFIYLCIQSIRQSACSIPTHPIHAIMLAFHFLIDWFW